MAPTLAASGPTAVEERVLAPVAAVAVVAGVVRVGELVGDHLPPAHPPGPRQGRAGLPFRRRERRRHRGDGQRPVSPSVSWATQARNAESAPPENATTTEPSSRSRLAAGRGVSHRRTSMRMRLLPLPFDSVFTTLMRPTSAVEAHVGATVGLLVQADDVDDADLGHRLGDQVHLRADEVLVRHRDGAGQEGDLDRSVGRQLRVDQLLDPRSEALRQRVELEVHPGRQRLHVPAGDRHPPLVPDDTAEHVQRGVRAHQRVAAIPVHARRATRRPRRGRRPASRCHMLAPSLRTSTTTAIRRPNAGAGVVRLAAPGRVEGGAVQDRPGLLDRRPRVASNAGRSASRR